MGSLNGLMETFETIEAAAIHRDRPVHGAVSVLLEFCFEGVRSSSLAAGVDRGQDRHGTGRGFSYFNSRACRKDCEQHYTQTNMHRPPLRKRCPPRPDLGTTLTRPQ